MHPSSFNSLDQASSLNTSQSSTFADQDVWGLEMLRFDTQSLPNDASESKEQPFLQTKQNLSFHKSFPGHPGILSHTEYTNFTNTTVSLGEQPPPYQPPDNQIPTKPHQHVNQHENQSSQWQQRNEGRLTNHDWNSVGSQNIKTNIAQTRPPKETLAPIGGRSATDRRNKTISEKKSARPVDSPPYPRLTPLLIDALHKSYPKCQTVRACMETLIRDYCLITGCQLVNSNNSKESFTNLRNQKGDIGVQASSNTHYESDVDDGVESWREGSEVVSDNEMDLDPNFSDIQDRMKQIRKRDDELPQYPSIMLPRPGRQSAQGIKNQTLFGCPFYHRNPTLYENNRLCSGSGWEEVRRVKAHVYTDHKLPITCARCSEPFKSDDMLKEHLRADPRCEIKKIDREGCSDEQEKELRSRKDIQGKTEAQKWIIMYKILFPREPIPSPFFEPRSVFCRKMLAKLKDNIIEELPKRIDQDMKPHLSIPGITKSMSRLKESVKYHTTELFNKLLEKEPSLSSTPEASRPMPKTMREENLSSALPTIGRGTNATASRLATHLPSRSARRRTHTELSRSPESVDHSSKRIAT